MPLVHCNKCPHEWEALSVDEFCAWCGHKGCHVLAEKTELELMIESDWWKNRFQRRL